VVQGEKLWLGLVSSNMQGWLVTLGFIAIIVKDSWKIGSGSHSASDTFMNFFPRTILLVLLLIFICYLKGEKPEWRWDGKKIKL